MQLEARNNQRAVDLEADSDPALSLSVEFVTARCVLRPPPRLMQTSMFRFMWLLGDVDSRSDADLDSAQ